MSAELTILNVSDAWEPRQKLVEVKPFTASSALRLPLT